MSSILFDEAIGPHQVLLSRVRVDLGATAIRGTPYSSKLQIYWNLTIRLFSVISRILVGGVLHQCRQTFGVSYSPSRLGHSILVGEVLPLCWDAFGVSYSPSLLDNRTLVGRVLPLFISYILQPQITGPTSGKPKSKTTITVLKRIMNNRIIFMEKISWTGQ